MRRIILSSILVIFTAFAPLTASRAETLGDADKAAITAVIESQLQAFASDDGNAAYAHAAPIVTTAFPTVEGFMAMVKKGYQPIYRNKGHRFTEATTDGLGHPSLRVILRGLDGKTYEASYFMEKQPDGSWKIAGVVMVPLPGTEV